MPASDAAQQTTPEVGGANTQPQNGREARNLAEKHRRDKLNASIQELATMVPHVAESTRRLDKTAVLRFAAHGLRLQYVFGKSANKNQQQPQLELPTPQQQQQHQPQPLMTDALMELLDSFFLTITCHGQIVLISANVEQLLGHCQSDLYGQNILQITHAEDQALMRQQLIPRDMETLFNTEYQGQQRMSTTDSDIDDDDDTDDVVDNEHEHEHAHAQHNATTDFYRTASPRSQAHFAEIDTRLRTDRRCFTVRLARAGTRSEATRSYEIVKIDGCFRRSDCSTNAGTFPIVSQLIRRSRNSAGSSSLPGTHLMQHDAIAQAALHGISGNDVVLVAVARIIRPPKILNRLLEPNRLEYRTRHLLDGCIIDCDQRISLVAGYMKEEVRNLSPFSFIHQDDVRWVVVALRQMYDLSDCGESCYRLQSRNGNFIYLQTRGYFEIDKSTNTAKSFVCVNTLLDEEEGKRKVQEMKTKFSIIIQTKIPSNSQQDVPASQNPQQLERIVKYLIENLEKRNEIASSSSSSSNALDATVAGRALTAPIKSAAEQKAATPLLALVPPEPSSVSRSISKSVHVINATQQLNLKSPASLHGSSETSLSPASSSDQMEEQFDGYNASPSSQLNSMAMLRPSVLHINKLITATTTNDSGSGSSCSSNNSNNNNKRKLPRANMCSSSSNSSSSSNNSFDGTTMNTQQQQHVSVLKRLHAAHDDFNVSAAKRSLHQHHHHQQQQQLHADTLAVSMPSNADEIHTVITASLQNLDNTLQDISNQTQTLIEQYQSFVESPVSVPSCIEEQLDAISVEQQMQEQELVHIKTEYDVHLQQQQLEFTVENVKMLVSSASSSPTVAATSELQPNE